MKKLKKIFFILTPEERRKTWFLLFLIIIMAFLDMIGVASIMPFITVLTNPELIQSNELLNKTYLFFINFGVKDYNDFIFYLGSITFLLLLFSLMFKALTTYVLSRFINFCEHSLSVRLLENYLNQPYSWFIDQNSADLGKSILSEVGKVVGSGIRPMIDLVAQTIVASALFILLLIGDPKLAIMISITLCLAYGLIYNFNRNLIKKIGAEHIKANQKRFMAVNETIGAIKEIKLSRLEQSFIEKFYIPAHKYASNSAQIEFIKLLPRYVLESIVFGGMLLVALYFTANSKSFINAIPILALYALAGYRLMPALQQIYVSIAALKFVSPALNLLHDNFLNLKLKNSENKKNIVEFKNSILFKNVNFSYSKTELSAIKNISLEISVPSRVGLVGMTGSGKTTLVDILLGLLIPQSGHIEVDGKIINETNIRSWQKSVGYVPQEIYLTDDTIAANIAFGVKNEEVDYDSLIRASKIANIHNFIIDKLPNKYETSVGERGIKLSGGQKQRIGIARAIYKNPKILVLDEATSALDYQTEKAVMDTLSNLSKDITVVTIAHRLNTLQKCDRIFMLNNGKIEVYGTYSELIKKNKNFQKISGELK